MPHHVRHIALIVGSLRRDSINRKVADYITGVAPQRWQISEIEIGDLPLYNQDLDAEPIEAYERVRGQIAAADVVLVVSPEHNRSVPAAVKNILDIASRPAGRGVWAGKKAAVVTASPGVYGGLSAGLHLRQILQALGVSVLVAPEVYLSRAFDALDEQGQLTDARALALLNRFVQALDAWLVD
ncbi:NADPH-dependent FMN reductase [Paralysiella testudinis]|uniref:NAD(P)H-dependent oxidoreductase n=1 Tax=Paralysiella testudinis TaxID=2809020 RepID=A0A892ZHJ2_9NEIS|nr:NADPH-dependent FMN reductase [Paralysiella testudinis]QRQ83015.1 NAD(P)H-dependent oxidoreductase [Paralysiella testudinis]